METFRQGKDRTKDCRQNCLGETVGECSPSLPGNRVGICSALVVTAKLFSKADQVTLSSVVSTRILGAPHPWQHLALSIFFILSHFGWYVVIDVILRTII